MAANNSLTALALAPSARVLGTYELLEEIMLHLPLKTLLLSKRVSKAWEDVWTKSHQVQKALFLMPFSDLRIYIDKANVKFSDGSGAFEVDIWVVDGRAATKIVIRPIPQPVSGDLHGDK